MILTNKQKDKLRNNPIDFIDENILKDNKLYYLAEMPSETKFCKSYTPLKCGYGYDVTDKIGEESMYGDIWKACCNKDCSYVLKWQKYTGGTVNKEYIQNEINLQKIFAEFGVSPPVIDSWFCVNGGIIIMPMLVKTAKYLLQTATNDDDINFVIDSSLSLLDYIHEQGYYHGDPHLNNIMTDNQDRFYLIDMGASGKGVENDFISDYKIFIGDLQHFTDDIIVTSQQMLNYNAKKYMKSDTKDKIMNIVYGLDKESDLYEKIKVTDEQSLEIEDNKEKQKALQEIIDDIINRFGLRN